MSLGIPLTEMPVTHNGLRHRFVTVDAWWASNQAVFPPEVIAAYQEAFRRPGAHACTLRYYRASSIRAMWGRRRYAGPQIAAPVLVVWGERDPVLPLRTVAYLKDDLPGARVVRIPGAGHFPHEEQPERVTRLLLAFLESHPGADGGTHGQLRGAS